MTRRRGEGLCFARSGPDQQPRPFTQGRKQVASTALTDGTKFATQQMTKWLDLK